MIRKLFKKITEKPKYIYSNVIQYDEMGYPLRLVLRGREQIWLDTVEQDGDVVLRWEETP